MSLAANDRVGCPSPSAKITHRALGQRCFTCWPGDGMPAVNVREEVGK